MKPARLLLITSLALAAAAALAFASDPVAVYARIDRVVLEPDAGAPQAIQIWGAFSLANPENGRDYLPPARGYLYFRLARDEDAARKEWADLKEIAGTGQIVSFGSRYDLRVRLRPADERPENPDAYRVSMGVTKIRGNTTYAPVSTLAAYRN
jgi:hypothetical protein